MVSGAFGKTRFPFFLLAMAGGRSWDHDGSLMRPPPEDKEMIDHVKHDMYFPVIAWETVRDHLEHVKDLMRSNNDDQGFAMGQHLIGRTSKMHAHCCAAAPPTPGQSMWDIVREQALAEAETNRAETLDKTRLATLVDFHL